MATSPGPVAAAAHGESRRDRLRPHGARGDIATPGPTRHGPRHGTGIGANSVESGGPGANSQTARPPEPTAASEVQTVPKPARGTMFNWLSGGPERSARMALQADHS